MCPYQFKANITVEIPLKIENDGATIFLGNCHAVSINEWLQYIKQKISGIVSLIVSNLAP